MKKPNFEELIDSAKNHQIDTSAAEFGFETRLMASIRELGRTESGFLDVFGNWLWKSSIGLTPIVAILITLAIILHGINIPNGTSGVISYVVDSLPFSDQTLSNR